MCLGEERITVLICIHILPGNSILLLHLVHQMPLPLLQHVQLGSQAENRILGTIFLLLGGTTAEPAPNSRHVDDDGDDVAEGGTLGGSRKGRGRSGSVKEEIWFRRSKVPIRYMDERELEKPNGSRSEIM